MSGTGSPADQQDQVDKTVDTGTPASVNADTGKDTPASGDANLSADASSASGDKGAKEAPKPTLADVIKTAAVADETGKSPDPANDGKAKPEGAKADEAKAETHDPKDDEKLPFHNHPRWKQVIGENAEYRKKVETLAPAAQQYERIQTFMDEHHLTHDEVGELFIVGAMAKSGDPRALERVDAYRDRLAAALGEKLPQDIQDQVDSGAITEAAGKEMSKLRARTAKADADASRNREVSEQRQREQAATDHAKACQAATSAWGTEIRKTDPEFAKKENAIARYSRAFIQERGFPKTTAEAVQLVKDAYAEVNKDLESIVPAKKAVQHVPSGSSSHGAKTAPKNLRDVIAAAASQ